MEMETKYMETETKIYPLSSFPYNLLENRNKIYFEMKQKVWKIETSQFQTFEKSTNKCEKN